MSLKPKYPQTMTKISDVSGEDWDAQVRVNRALWRRLSFREQAEICTGLNDLYLKLETYLDESRGSIWEEQNGEAQAETKPEAQAEPAKLDNSDNPADSPKSKRSRDH